jgi:hypothetical protein
LLSRHWRMVHPVGAASAGREKKSRSVFNTQRRPFLSLHFVCRIFDCGPFSDLFLLPRAPVRPDRSAIRGPLVGPATGSSDRFQRKVTAPADVQLPVSSKAGQRLAAFRSLEKDQRSELRP